MKCVRTGLVSSVLFIFLLNFHLSATILYIAVDGDDGNTGESGSPLRSITRAVSLVSAGDTIYMLRGTYFYTTGQQISSSVSGTADDPIILKAFPGDTVVIDFYQQAFGERGISLKGDYWLISGLTICHAGDNGIFIDGNHNRVENCIIFGNDDSGLQISGGGSYNVITNCDAYYNIDPDNGDADGFAAKLDIGPGNEFHYCRSWNNADDGWDLYEADDSVVIDHCITFRNGYLQNESLGLGEGNGFKLGGNHLPANHLVTNCISFDNYKYGFHQNNNTGKITIYNSLGFDNVSRNFNFYYETAGPNVLVNNVSFGGGTTDRFINCTQMTNSWQGIDANEEDYISLIKALAKDARLPDGSLPGNLFARLDVGSNLIDQGTDCGLSYNGSAPDLGPYESAADGEFQVILTVAGKGGVWLNPGGGLYPAGQEVQLIAWSAEGYQFANWEGDLTGTEDTTILVMDTDKSVICNFSPLSDVPPDSVRIEAEDMIFVSGYIYERFSGASEGKVIRPTTTSFAGAHTYFNGVEGYHKAIIRYLDQANGAATYRFTAGNNTADTWTGDSSASGNLFLEREIINLLLMPGDELKVESQLNGQEYGRVDCIDLIKSEYIEPVDNLRNLNLNHGLTADLCPNPSNSETRIRFSLPRQDYPVIEIYSSQGVLINRTACGSMEEGNYELELVTGGMTEGLYHVKLITTAGTEVQAMIRL